MAKKEEVRKRRLNDVDLYSIEVFLRFLIPRARTGQTFTYTDMVELAPEQNSPRTIGRRLTWIRFFTIPRQLPDLGSFVVTKKDNEAGYAFDKNAARERQKCRNVANWHENEIHEFLLEMGRSKEAGLTFADLERKYGINALN